MMKTLEPKSLATGVYEHIKSEIFDFCLLPGDRFTETEVAARVGVSRTPVREALYRLEREGYIDVSARNGWNVKPFDFTLFENLYDVRIVLEVAAIRRLCEMEGEPDLDDLQAWLAPVDERIRDPLKVSEMDEAFHQKLVIAAGNPEMARIHRDISERIRIIRRLDFTKPERIDTITTSTPRSCGTCCAEGSIRRGSCSTRTSRRARRWCGRSRCTACTRRARRCRRQAESSVASREGRNARQSARMLASLITFAHFSVSFFRCVANSSGVLAITPTA